LFLLNRILENLQTKGGKGKMVFVVNTDFLEIQKLVDELFKLLDIATDKQIIESLRMMLNFLNKVVKT